MGRYVPFNQSQLDNKCQIASISIVKNLDHERKSADIKNILVWDLFEVKGQVIFKIWDEQNSELFYNNSPLHRLLVRNGIDRVDKEAYLSLKWSFSIILKTFSAIVWANKSIKIGFTLIWVSFEELTPSKLKYCQFWELNGYFRP